MKWIEVSDLSSKQDTNMDFGKALEALKAGKKVRRAGAFPIVMENGNLFVISFSNNKELMKYMHQENIFAEDWEIVEDIPEVKIEYIPHFTCPRCGVLSKYNPKPDKTAECEFCKKKVEPIEGLDINCSPKTDTSEYNIYTKPISAWFLSDFPSYSNIKTKEEAEIIVNKLLSEYTNSKDFIITLPSLNIDKTLKPGEIIIKNPDKYTTTIDFKL